MKFMLAALFALGASAQTSKLIGTKQDCCRYNGANVGNVKNADSFDKCEAGCRANKNCNFLSYNKSWKACSLCSKCDLSSKSHGRHYNSWEMTMTKAPTPVPAPTPKPTTKLIGTKQDCCRYNNANVGNVKNADFDKCEAGCRANKNCNFFSYNKSWKACALCSKCDLSSKSHGRHYDSWEMNFALKT